MKPITNAEVLAEASRKCKTCRGSGFYRKWIHPPLPDGSGIDTEVQYRQEVVCACAKTRFRKKYAGRFEEKEGTLSWREAA